MALTENEKKTLIEVVTLATATSNDKLITSIEKQTKVNTQLFDELKVQTGELKLITAKVTNGMSSNISLIKADVEKIVKDTSDKDGILPKLYSTIKYA
jgi:hypothetical protein